MPKQNSQSVLEQLNWRYAVKKFDPTKKISDPDWKVLEESLRLSPSSYGLQPWKFLVVQNPELRDKLVAASWGQTQAKDCSHLVVLTYKKKLDVEHIEKNVKRMSEVRGTPIDKLDGFKKMAIDTLVNGPRAQTIDCWAQKQGYIAMGFLMETAAMLGIDTCPMEGIEPEKYNQILNLEGTGFTTLAAVPCGYRHADDKYQTMSKVRFEAKDVFQYL